MLLNEISANHIILFVPKSRNDGCTYVHCSYTHHFNNVINCITGNLQNNIYD